MTTEADAIVLVIPDLKLDEGLRLEAYPDPIHGWKVPTIGYGHTGPDVHQGDVWTQAQADAHLAADVENAAASLDARMAWWLHLDPVRGSALLNLAFNMGVAKLQGFYNFLALLKAGQWYNAANDLLHTLADHQEPERIARIANLISTGVHP